MQVSNPDSSTDTVLVKILCSLKNVRQQVSVASPGSRIQPHASPEQLAVTFEVMLLQALQPSASVSAVVPAPAKVLHNNDLR